MDWLASDHQLRQLVQEFENGTLAESSWHHREHLAVCFFYLSQTSLVDAVFKIKLGILKYNERYRIAQTKERGYHETITLFFVKVVHRYVAELVPDGTDLVSQLQPLVDRHPGFLPLLWEYYSKPLLNSIEARVQWIEPDLKAF